MHHIFLRNQTWSKRKVPGQDAMFFPSHLTLFLTGVFVICLHSHFSYYGHFITHRFMWDGLVKILKVGICPFWKHKNLSVFHWYLMSHPAIYEDNELRNSSYCINKYPF